MKLGILLLACLVFPLAAFANDADADKMIAEFTAKKAPALDMSRKDDHAYVQSYIQQRKEFEAARAQFGKDFYEKYPTDPRAMEFMNTRWQILAATGKPDDVIEETEKLLADNPEGARRADMLFARGMAKVIKGTDEAAATAAVDEFIKAFPKDMRGAVLLNRMAQTSSDPAKKAALTKRIADEYPDSDSGRMAKGQLRRTEAIGKPFELAFTDAISGKEIKMADLKGKVVVVDFWATWCGPCVGEMPTMKKLYAEYKDKGVEFIGVSLDQPGEGLQQLKDFVSKEKITWPQYYQGKAWSSEFSGSWGVNSIPCVFVIDADGNLHSTNARGKLENLIPTLLKAAKPVG